MANYVYSKVVCSKSTLDTYFIDPTPLGEPQDEPYISFNKLFGVPSLNDYGKKIGIYIYYGFGFSWTRQDSGLYEIKFATRWQYPIQAIVKAVELDHDLKWFVVEECCAYVSKFYWSGGVKEDIMRIDADMYYAWNDDHMDLEDSLDDCDNLIWYYPQLTKGQWKTWESEDGFERYRDIDAYKIHPAF